MNKRAHKVIVSLIVIILILCSILVALVLEDTWRQNEIKRLGGRIRMKDNYIHELQMDIIKLQAEVDKLKTEIYEIKEN